MRRIPTSVAIFVCVTAVSAFFLALLPLSAQELRGSLLVEVQDTSGSAIPAAQVALSEENSATHLSQTRPSPAARDPSAPSKPRIPAVSSGGSSGLNIDFAVDGGDNNDDFIGGFLQNYPPEAMQEFVVRSAQFGSETSRSNGGSIVLATRPGSNDRHRRRSYYYRATNLNSRNPPANPAPPPHPPF